MIVFRRLPLAASAVILSISVACLGQDAQVTGFVRDASNAFVPGAQVTLENLGTHEVRTAITNSKGAYLLPGLAAGSYRARINAPGFASIEVPLVRTAVDARVTLDFHLQVGSVGETVEVHSGNSEINTSDGAVSTVVDPQFVSNMPLNGRSFQSLLTLAPGVSLVPSQGIGTSGEISVNGQRTESNYFTVDGISVNTGIPASGVVGQGAGYSGSTPGETVLGSTQSMVTVDALQEFRASTSTYSAVYGRVPGGQFSFQTRSGTERLHGSAFEYLRNERFDANDWFSNALGVARQKSRQNDYGGVLGGALPFHNVNRTFFFGSYEGMQLSTPSAAQQYQVPGAALRTNSNGSTLRAVLNAFPIANGTTLSNGLAYHTAGFSIPSRLDVGAIRVDQNFGSRTHAFVRFQETRSSRTGRLAANVAETMPSSVDIRSTTAGITQTLSPHLANDFRFNLTWNDSSLQYVSTAFGGATPFDVRTIPQLTSDPYNRVYVGLNFGSVPNFSYLPQSTSQRQINLVDWFTFSAGRHTLTFGGDYRRLNDLAQMPTLYNPVTYSTAAQVLANTPGSNALAKINVPVLYPVFNNLSAYAQDDWRASDRLSISMGVRWEWNPAPTDGAGNDPYTVDQIANLATTKIATRGTPQWSTQYSAFAPRVGLAYHAVDGSFATVLRTGFGVFYDTTVANSVGGYARQGYRATTRFTNQPFPLTSTQIAAAPTATTTPPYTETIFATDPKLKLPYTYQYNAALEQQLGAHQSLLVNYVGSAGHRMLATRSYSPSVYGNTRFSSSSVYLLLTQNVAAANYNALQVQFKREMYRDFQVLGSYTWSHTMDDTTTNFQVYELTRAASDYDIRHNLQAAVTYALPTPHTEGFAKALMGGWAADARVALRSALPIDIIGQNAVVDSVAGTTVNFHPNRVANQPLYVASNAYGLPVRRINPAAFVAATPGTEGNVGRNYARGFAALQTDFALRKQFILHDSVNLQLRGEAFNVFNQHSFGSVYNLLSNTSFGLPYNNLNSQLGGLDTLHQQGGPRSLQLAARLNF